jgi:hypothetical protein
MPSLKHGTLWRALELGRGAPPFFGRTLTAIKTHHRVIEDSVDIGFGERSCTHQQAVIDRRVQQIDSGFNVDIRPQFSIANGFTSRASAFRNRVVFLEAGLQILEVYRNAGL